MLLMVILLKFIKLNRETKQVNIKYETVKEIYRTSQKIA